MIQARGTNKEIISKICLIFDKNCIGITTKENIFDITTEDNVSQDLGV